jgi:ATP-dependent Lon protease
MGRRYHRIALGGVRDEAEVRGHRRTYVGALPGRIIQGMKKVGREEPGLVLDEVDKLGVDVMGDPSAALLEVLDPEQNSTFQDHYLDSRSTSRRSRSSRPRTTRHHPEAALGPLEVIEVPGYTRMEKRHIATEFLCPKQLSAHGLTDERLEFTGGLERIIDSYTREAGRARARARDRRGVPPRRDAPGRG